MPSMLAPRYGKVACTNSLGLDPSTRCLKTACPMSNSWLPIVEARGFIVFRAAMVGLSLRAPEM